MVGNEAKVHDGECVSWACSHVGLIWKSVGGLGTVHVWAGAGSPRVFFSYFPTKPKSNPDLELFNVETGDYSQTESFLALN